MNHCRLAILLLVIGSQFIVSCDWDDKKIVCRPLTVKFSAYTEEYEYNEAHKVETILYHVPDVGTRTGKLDYNDKGQLIKLTLLDFNSPPQAYYTCELIYDGQDKPQKLYVAGWGSISEATFFHDEKQRLVKIEGEANGVPGSGRRYEYDDNDNVIKIFSIYETEEFLYATNLSYDNKPRLFSQVPELETLTTYMDGYVPSKNNVLAAELHEDSPDATKVDPRDVTFAVEYDEAGLITSFPLPTDFVFRLLYFEQATYNCRP